MTPSCDMDFRLKRCYRARGVIPHHVRHGLPWIVAAQRLVGVAVEEWLKGYGCHWSLQRRVICSLLVDTLGIFGGELRVRNLLGDRGAVAESTCEAFRNDWSARDGASGVCLHIVDGREDAAAALAGRS
ncbi:hypothetical protein TcBrA4_0046880 [Trypanosoma cruzi]|nr:hypothetical protein TcBrA4_0046880 [Trypanosoma cruzi]